MYHTIARGGADGEQNGIFCAYCFFRNNARKDFSVDTPCSQSHGGRTSNFCLIFSTPRLAKRMAALNLATVTSMPATNKACRDAASTEANAFTADWTLGCRSETNSQALETTRQLKVPAS